MDLTSLLLFMGALFFLMIVGPMRKQKKEKKIKKDLVIEEVKLEQETGLKE